MRLCVLRACADVAPTHNFDVQIGEAHRPQSDRDETTPARRPCSKVGAVFGGARGSLA